jgi:hypothetical protein
MRRLECIGQPVTDSSTIFDFEKDFADTLRCIPMAVRFKLDACGVKLASSQWAQFTKIDRDRLLLEQCATQDEVVAYRDFLIALIESRSGEEAQMTVVHSHPAWGETTSVPMAVRKQAWSLGLEPPSLGQWVALAPLGRFALLKLARPGHRNLNFEPALREFGLIAQTTSVVEQR